MYQIRKDHKISVYVNGSVVGSGYDGVKQTFFLNDGRPVYVSRRGKQWSIVVNGKETAGFPDETIDQLIIPPGMRTFYYFRPAKPEKAGLQKGRAEDIWELVDAEGNAGPPIRTKEPLMNFSESSEHMAYCGPAGSGPEGERQVVIADNKTAVDVPVGARCIALAVDSGGRPSYILKSAGDIVLKTPKGSRSIKPSFRSWLFNIPSEEEYMTESAVIALSEDGPHYAYTIDYGTRAPSILGFVKMGEDRGGSVLIHDGKAGKSYNLVRQPVLSRDGKSVAYKARIKEKNEFRERVVINGSEGPLFERITGLQFEAQPATVSYLAAEGSAARYVLGNLLLDQHYHSKLEGLVTGHSGRIVSYIARPESSSRGRFSGCVISHVHNGGNETSPFSRGLYGPDEEWLDFLEVLEDDRHLSYITVRGGKLLWIITDPAALSPYTFKNMAGQYSGGRYKEQEVVKPEVTGTEIITLKADGAFTFAVYPKEGGMPEVMLGGKYRIFGKGELEFYNLGTYLPKPGRELPSDAGKQYEFHPGVNNEYADLLAGTWRHDFAEQTVIRTLKLDIKFPDGIVEKNVSKNFRYKRRDGK